MITSSVTPAISRLSRDGDLVFWSLIVSALGELTEAPDDVITNRLFARMTGLMGLKPQALRVALHRLRKEGWIDSVKTGRTVAHRLSARGYAETRQARPRIYADKSDIIQSFTLILGANSSKHAPPPQDADWIPLSAGAYLHAGTKSAAPAGFFALTGQVNAIPDWLPALIAPPALGRQFQDLSVRLDEVRAVLEADRAPLSALERACLRVLIVHHWRRLLLRCPDLPDRFFPPNWAGICCRRKVAGLLGTIPRPTRSELDNQ